MRFYRKGVTVGTQLNQIPVLNRAMLEKTREEVVKLVVLGQVVAAERGSIDFGPSVGIASRQYQAIGRLILTIPWYVPQVEVLPSEHPLFDAGLGIECIGECLVRPGSFSRQLIDGLSLQRPDLVGPGVVPIKAIYTQVYKMARRAMALMAAESRLSPFIDEGRGEWSDVSGMFHKALVNLMELYDEDYNSAQKRIKEILRQQLWSLHEPQNNVLNYGGGFEHALRWVQAVYAQSLELLYNPMLDQAALDSHHERLVQAGVAFCLGYIPLRWTLTDRPTMQVAKPVVWRE